MNLSMKWLADYVKLDITPKEFCAGMTMSGSKVEAFEEEAERCRASLSVESSPRHSTKMQMHCSYAVWIWAARSRYRS